MPDKPDAGRLHRVWLDKQEKIASFHPVEGYGEQSFFDHDFFMNFLHALQAQGFRFQ